MENKQETKKEEVEEEIKDSNQVKLPQKNQQSSLAMTGFIFSIIGIITCGLASIVGLVISTVGLSDCKKKKINNSLALVGVILSAIPLAIYALVIGVMIISEEVEVADFSTMTIQETKEWCEKNSVSCDIVEEYSDSVANGKLISQEEEAGKKVRSIFSLKIVYSKGIRGESENSINNKEKPKVNEKSEEEKKNDYKASCEEIAYNDIARQPDTYKGKKAHFRGKVIQVQEGWSNSVTLRVSVTEGEYGLWTDTVYVTYKYKKGENKILDNDIVNMYGFIKGTKTYTTVLGSSVTIPELSAKYIEIE